MRRAESCKVEFYDQMSDWSNSYRQGHSGQLSEIAEAHSDDAFRGTGFVETLNKPNPFEQNYYSSSTRSRLARRQISKELTESQRNAEAAINKFVDQYPVNEEARPDNSNITKTQSFSKPVLPPLNIARVKDDPQNVLAIKNFQEATRNKSTGSPHLSAGLSRVGAIGEFNLSVGEDGSFIKGDTSRRDQVSSLSKLRNLARRLGESYFIKDLPALSKIVGREKDYETFAGTHGFNTQDPFKLKSAELNSQCSCQKESKFLLLKQIQYSKEDHTDQHDGAGVSGAKEEHLDNKMRLCLLNLFLKYIERFDTMDSQSFFNSNNTSSHPVNLLYCHMSSNEILSKFIDGKYLLSNQKQQDLTDQMFSGKNEFILDFDGTIHNISKNNKSQDESQLVNNSFLENFVRGDGWRLPRDNTMALAPKADDFSDFLESKLVFKPQFISENSCIFKILQKIAI